MTKQEQILRNIAKRNYKSLIDAKLAEGLTLEDAKFDIFHKLIKLYDDLKSFSEGNDLELCGYLINEAGYAHCETGGWILMPDFI
jgi:hypothetical protein